jgi:MOSC domain-containing protein YiiM
MKALAYIQSIYIAHGAGLPMQLLATQTEIGITGLSGDRYALNKGAYSNAHPEKIRHISLIAQSAITAANAILSASGNQTYSEAETRRNIALSNITPNELNDLVGKIFKLGEATLKGVELCAPCERPAKLLNKTNFMNAFVGLGGLRAEVIRPGLVCLGDALTYSEGGRT